MTLAITAYGALIERSQNGTTFTPIPEAKGIALPSTSREYIDATHLQSPGGFREYVRGLKDLGEISFPANFTAAGFAQQLADQDFTGGPITYRVTLPMAPGQTAASRFTFQGYPVVSMDDVTDPDDILTMTITVRTTGDFTFTAGTGGA